MIELEIKETELSSGGSWPVKARADNLDLSFSENWQPPYVRSAIAGQQAKQVLNLILALVGAFGVVALFLHFVTPIADFWLRIFALTLLTDIWYWTRIVQKGPVVIPSSGSFDVKEIFSDEALLILRKAILTRGQQQAHPLHLLLQLLNNENVRTAFYRLGLGYRQLASLVLSVLPSLNMPPPALDRGLAELPFLAFGAARDLRQKFITPLLLLVALGRLSAESRSGQVFDELAITPNMIFESARWRLSVEKLVRNRARKSKFALLKPKGEINRSLTSVPTPILNRYSTDLTYRARLGYLAYVVGREEDLVKILAAFNSERPAVLVVGEPGVGKTSIIDLLTEKMLLEEVPERILDRRLVRLELSQILGEGDNAGQALTAAINDGARGGDIVLVVENIDEFAQSQVNGVNLVSILMAAVKNAGLPLLATATPQSFQATPLLQSSSFFERIDVSEVLPEDTILIACIHASLLESKHNVFWMYEAVQKAVELSSRYLQGERQPEKTVKVLEILSERMNSNDPHAPRVIGEKDVARIISELAHVKAEDVDEGESAKLLNLEQKLHGKIIGQEAAVKAVAEALRRARAKLTTGQGRPLASFLFVGPTGVGKTGLAETLAEIEFGAKEQMVRLDLSEYNLPESIERLLGGRTFTSSFVAQVRERPYCVILLDEIEKAHADIQNVFLQVMDEGHLTDNAGSKLDLTNTIIIATSNAAAAEIQNGFQKGVSAASLTDRLVHEFLPKYFRPELLNRFDDIILFEPLKLQQVAKIVEIELNQIGQKLSEQGITLKVTPAGAQKIAAAAYDPVFGARPIRRYLQENIENQIANWILAHELERRDAVVIGEDGQARIEKTAELGV